MTNAHAADDGPSLAGTRMLRSGRLVVEVMDPASPDRYNRGMRFSSVANVLRARLDGREFLYAPGGAGHDFMHANGGLASEFDIIAELPPPGFEEAAIGDCFVKIGVGVLRKNAAYYDFAKDLPVVAAAATSVSWREDRADFEQVCAGANGYAYRLTAEVRVERDRLDIKFKLTNAGQKPFTTMQYLHNFFAFDGAGTSPAYEIEFPYDLPAQASSIELAHKDRKLMLTPFPPSPEVFRQTGRWLGFQDGLASPKNVRVPWPTDYRGANWVKLGHRDSGMGITATTSIPGPFVQVHVARRYVCPEQFVRIALAPGESAEWLRSYLFELRPPIPEKRPKS